MKSSFLVKKYLVTSGIVFILLGALSFMKVVGPTATTSLFHQNLYFDKVEIWAYGIVGVINIVGSLILSKSLQRYVGIIEGVIALAIALYGFLVSPVLYGANLEVPFDNILLLIIAGWAFYSVALRQERS